MMDIDKWHLVMLESCIAMLSERLTFWSYNCSPWIHYYSAPGRGAEYRDQLVCLSVCLCVWPRVYLWNRWTDRFTKFSVQISCGRGSVLLWRHCDTLCTSGCKDDVTFGRSGPYGDALRYRGGVYCLWMPCRFCCDWTIVYRAQICYFLYDWLVRRRSTGTVNKCLANAKRPCDCRVLPTSEKFTVVRTLFQTWRHSAVVTKVVTVCAQCSEYQREEIQQLSLIHIWRCRRIERCRSRWSPYH